EPGQVGPVHGGLAGDRACGTLDAGHEASGRGPDVQFGVDLPQTQEHVDGDEVVLGVGRCRERRRHVTPHGLGQLAAAEQIGRGEQTQQCVAFAESPDPVRVLRSPFGDAPKQIERHATASYTSTSNTRATSIGLREGSLIDSRTWSPRTSRSLSTTLCCVLSTTEATCCQPASVCTSTVKSTNTLVRSWLVRW